MNSKIPAGARFPEIDLPKVGGGNVKIGGDGRWQMAIVYRGKHCPLCKKYLGGLDALKDKIRDAGIEVVALSADTAEQATDFAAEVGLDVPVGYGLNEAQMKQLGLYISSPRPNETDHDFPEPGLFVINPDGNVQVVDISNAPFARPDIDSLLNGIAFIQAKGYPIRGTAG
ncbi:MAG: thioredoxin peroxidase [Rhizobiales bacterium NRL2]|mgnify:CR=1 FL=1|nr:MAG: thioredoxin peroxidase [Rhizobiales bacterium NRL2]